MNYKSLYQLVCVLFIILFAGCYSDNRLLETEDDLFKISNVQYKTENVIVVVIDGPRQSETWQSEDRRYIPYMEKELAPKGVIISQFYNYGATYTLPGHVAITTGDYESISRSGDQFPMEPSFFQLWLKTNNAPKEKAWIITSKYKLHALSNCKEVEWRDSFNPSVDAANREDTITFKVAKEILSTYKPRLILLHFRGPDDHGHSGIWENYVNSIKETDSLTFELWNFIENHEFYKGKTTMIVTNDHGRHLDNIATGFIEHGDQCLGCTHINFYAIGPDFKKNIVSEIEREQTHILPTIGELMGFQISDYKEIMWELFK